MTLFEAYVTNAGKYADYGVEVGEPLKFPTTTEEVQALLKRIGVDGVRYQEIFIVSFDGDVLGLYRIGVDRFHPVHRRSLRPGKAGCLYERIYRICTGRYGRTFHQRRHDLRHAGALLGM